MRVQNLFSKRTAEDPKGSLLASHKLLIRGGYVKQVGQGIFTMLPLATRVARKIERVLREEMDGIGGQEMLMPVTAPDALWKQSGRFEGVGAELVRFEDRTGQGHVLNMTHEEAVVDAAAACIDSYKQLPLMVYQIQIKFRDEPRSRGGLIRVREFTMKDAYSFHRTQEDLESYYNECHAAYERFFRRIGLRSVISIESDVGMMGGSKAHEFMFLSEHGEDHLILCDESGYRANREVARFDLDKLEFLGEEAPLEEVETPGVKTIEEVAAFLKTTAAGCCRANALIADEERPIITFVRGDLAVSYPKTRAALGCRDLRPMAEEEIKKHGIVAGFLGPIGLPDGIEVLVDETVARAPNLVIGSNKEGFHTTGYKFDRDTPSLKRVDIGEAAAGLPCPISGAPLRATNGIEVGNIFQLGTKYSEAMDFVYSEEDQKRAHPIMGCYGIGVGRSLACLIEEHHDENGPKWPIDMAPFEVAVCCIQAKKEPVREAGESLYNDLRGMGVETILDDRKIGTGFLFADADLIAAPVRAVISPRNLDGGEIEMKYRVVFDAEAHGADLPATIPVEGAAETIRGLVEKVRAIEAAERAGLEATPA